jgi:(4S)-4-hydroxy-5-phosphonooxypentane-2,3-dione isomerase
MYVVVVEFTLNPGCSIQFRDRVRRQASDSLTLEPDCLVFDVCVDPLCDDVVFLYELYSDRAAFDAHLGSSHFRDFDAAVRGWISAKKVKIYSRI